ncbi:MAG: rubrerythrin family protein [Clostridium sp.]|uniref:rubrerythrin n=1 Tax=Clostridium sp. DSM 8431 TaxID=1761781 RepID=UPI0008E4B553|nr:rubrerythrin family protein [Clostridium sp. DSM 8431]MCR4944213.1 rubrerythrin family protein [Clostridium sp.]SFU80734.1 Rubrerythrin [Clostridium sp. DSM 8431]
MELKDSKTKENLLKAFAGESQARNRYEYASEVAKKEGLYIIKNLFEYTANQEKAHGEVFYGELKEFNGENIEIKGTYPIGNYDSTLKLLKDSVHNEFEEYNNIYKDFANIARNEGFEPIAAKFDKIAGIEKIHSERFQKYLSYLESGMLFKDNVDVQWICTNCGYIYEGKEAPKVCPVCAYPQGYYMKFTESDFNIKIN